MTWPDETPLDSSADTGGASTSVVVERRGPIRIVTINRPQARNAVDQPAAEALYRAFEAFSGDAEARVAILTGADGTFCSGADLKAIATERGNRVEPVGPEAIVGRLGPMGPTRMALNKPVIAAIEGYAVAGGLELALWCDLRVVASDAKLGVFCRRWGVPLVDGGTVRLPRLVGQSRAMDLILTGREVPSDEALTMGLANRVCPPGQALSTAIELAGQLADLPQQCLRSDRRSVYDQWSLTLGQALSHETDLGLETIRSGETGSGAQRFAAGAGRHGEAAPESS